MYTVDFVVFKRAQTNKSVGIL